MSNYMIPTDADFIETVAKAIARSRLIRDALKVTNMTQEESKVFEPLFDSIFESIWAGDTDLDEAQRASYRQDAIDAINAINLKMITA